VKSAACFQGLEVVVGGFGFLIVFVILWVFWERREAREWCGGSRRLGGCGLEGIAGWVCGGVSAGSGG
jgi:hypothetical protein